MELDCYFLGDDLHSIGEAASNFEALGHGCLWSIESTRDPFLPLVAAAARTTRMRIGTNVAVAFARTPMTVAQTAHDLQRLSGGRFVLGLGTQVRAHIERRYSMVWSAPAARMREFVRALRAIWQAWETGGPLSFEGDFYRHTLMAPNFDAGPTGFGTPPVYLAAIGRRMASVAGEVGDGLLCHPLTTPEYLSGVVMPAVADGRESARRDGGFSVVVSVLAATGRDGAALETSIRNVRRKIAFYASTSAYLPMLEMHGLGYLQPELNELARNGRWEEMERLVGDDVLERFAVVGSPGDIGRAVRNRFEGLADRATVYELDPMGRLMLTDRYLAEPGPLTEMMAGFHTPSSGTGTREEPFPRGSTAS